MRRLILAVVFSALAAGGAFAQSSDIRNTIQDQIEAFKADDFDMAFTFASPMIQRFFRTPGNFGQMVRQGYPMVWRPADVRFLDLSAQGGLKFQKVMIRDQAGVFHVLEYQMIKVDGDWQINGVRLLPRPELGV